MKIFRTDPAAAVAAEQKIRTNIAGQLAELDRKRPELLLSDDVTLVAKLDVEVERLLRADRVHIERIAVLEQAQREARKDAALIAFEKKLAGRVEAARRVEAAIAEFSASLQAYEAAAAAPFMGSWPADLFAPLREYWQFASSNLVSRIGSADVLDIRSAAPIRLREIAQRIGPIAERDQSFAESLIESLKAAPLPPLPGRANDDGIAAA